MPQFEYRVVPAPKRGKKAKGIRGPEAQFANALEEIMNEAGADGWDYLRTDTLPAEERSGLTGRTTVFQNMLVFRRVIETEAEAEAAPAEAPAQLPPPVAATPADTPPAPVTPAAMTATRAEGDTGLPSPNPELTASMSLRDGGEKPLAAE